MTLENSRKKILLVTRPIAPPWDEASKNFAFYLAKNLSAFDFYLLTNGFVPDLPPHIHQKAIYTSNKLTYMQRIRLLKLRHVLRENFDVIHYMLTPTKLNAFSFKTFIKTKKARTIQTIATLREDLFKDKDFKNILFADLIITYSDYAKNRLNSIGFNNVKRVYPGIDLKHYYPSPKDSDLMKQFSIDEKDFIITYPGEYTRLGATDDIDQMIINNANDFRKKDIKIVLANRIKNEADLKKKKEVVQKLKDSNVFDRVIFIDTFADMPKLYNLSDVIIFPVQDMKGKFDVPLAAIEPMACEKPVIISDLPILGEFANKNNSVIIPRGDIDALYRAIIDLYGNKEKREELGKNARKFVEENFDINNIAEIYRKIYEKL